MARGRGLFGQVVLMLALMAAAFVGARLGLLGTQDAGASHDFGDVVAIEPARGSALPGNPGGTVLLRMWYTIARAF
jgi:hypothetical protein